MNIFYLFSISFILTYTTHIYRNKDKTGGEGTTFRNSQEGAGDKKEGHLESANREQAEEVKLDADDTTTTNIDQDQEESSMWQKCPVITFQTFDDLTGWLA